MLFTAALQLAESAFSERRLFDAETDDRYVLEHDPGHLPASERMGFLLGVTGRRSESSRYLMSLVRSAHRSLEELIFLVDLDRPVDQGRMLRQFAQSAPDDIAVRLGLAAQAVRDQQQDVARELLAEIVSEQPGFTAAHALLGESLIDSDEVSYESWRANLPKSADEHPTIWFIRGVRARQRGELRVAARCFYETLIQSPNHRRAVYQLGQVLVKLELSSGDELAARSRQLYELTRSMNDVVEGDGTDPSVLRHVVDLLQDTGRILEARAWALYADRSTGSSEWRGLITRLNARITPDTPPVLAPMNLALRFELSDFPAEGTRSPASNADVASDAHGGIRFVEGTSGGIEFEYNNGPDKSTKGVRMFEQNGGGVAVVDFDMDSWPDLYFPQGVEWKHGATACSLSLELTDRLYRNLRGLEFRDVTARCDIDEREFSQGCAAGDSDNDGFPDLYVANLGCNRLFHNNGDCTFTDRSSTLTPQDWTSSCAVVDLNADGNPDLFDVNFISGEDVCKRICDDIGCNPRSFSGVPDRLLISRGDGTFAHVPDMTPTRQPKGLGFVAAALRTRGRPDLSIANDAVPNFLLQNSPAAETTFNISLTEAGFPSGLAFDRNGLAQACMGIAADDVDGDGRIDFFVTNFRLEPNTLYLQTSPGHFVDATHAARLDAPAMPYVSWGTQFLDPDLDGDLDIVVVNGHVADNRIYGGDYHQRPQIFENTGDTRFRELTAAAAGDYFGREFLGRGLARIDWDRDGRMDFAVSNMLSQASLVTNVSEKYGHYFSLLLRATLSARDAVGTVVELKTRDREWTKKLAAGDGYMASNERLLQSGLGSVDSVSSLRVTWPSGTQQSFTSLLTDATMILVEGHDIRPYGN
ncbi:MAG: FG-GAP-like repeat-containing protein [Fuerstiella sp.]|nr:FG-GAP-like repeat-containing protein [Fuerstiella sp.]